MQFVGDNSSYTMIFVQKVNPVMTNMESYENLVIPLQVDTSPAKLFAFLRYLSLNKCSKK